MRTNRELTKIACEQIMGWRYWDCANGDYNGKGPMFSFLGDGADAAYYGDAEDPQRYFNPFESIDDALALAMIVARVGDKCQIMLKVDGFTEPGKPMFEAWAVGKAPTSRIRDAEAATALTMTCLGLCGVGR